MHSRCISNLIDLITFGFNDSAITAPGATLTLKSPIAFDRTQFEIELKGLIEFDN